MTNRHYSPFLANTLHHAQTKTLTLATSLLLLSTMLCPHASAISPKAYEKFKQGFHFERMGDLTQAEQHYRLALALDPTDTITYAHLANLLAKSGRFDEALSLYQSAFNLDPRDKMLHLNMAQINEAKGDYYKALSHYMMLVDSPTGRYNYAYLPIARLQLKIGDQRSAIASYGEFLKHYPAHPEARHELETLGITPPPADAKPLIETPSPAIQPLQSNAMQPEQIAPAYSAPLFQNDPIPPLVYTLRRPSPQELLPLPQVPATPANIITAEEETAALAMREGRLQDAAVAYERAINANPPVKYPLYLNLADIATKLNDPSKTEAALSAYNRFDPNNARVLLGLGDIAVQRQDYRGAAQQYARALMNASDPQMKQDIRKHFGYAVQMLGDNAQAETLYAEVLRNEPNATDVQKNLAIVYQQQGKLKEALAVYKSLPTLDAQNPSIAEDKGNVLFALANQSLIAKQPDDAKRYYEEAKLLGGKWKTEADKALANLKSKGAAAVIATTTPIAPAVASTTTPYGAIPKSTPVTPPTVTPKTTVPEISKPAVVPTIASATTPPSVAATPKITTANAAAVMKEAKAYFDKAQYEMTLTTLDALQTQTKESYLLAADSHEKLENTSQAAMALENALELSPNNVDILSRLGHLHRQAGDLEQAKGAFEKVIAAKPKSAETLYDLGVIHQMQNHPNDAISHFQKAIDANPKFADAYYGLGVAQEGQKKYTEAVDAYDKYLAMGDADPAISENLKKHVGLLRNFLIMAKQVKQ